MKKWMKAALLLIMVCICVVGCGKSKPTWQEQYDLGMRYLEEGDYEQAIVAFTAAIEIDPNQALAYVGRADGYVASEQHENHFQLAQVDYEKAIELDGTDVTVYTRLADAYLQTEDYEKAEDAIRRGREKLGEQEEFSQYEQKIQDVQPLNLADTTLKKLERLFEYLYYDGIGNGSAQVMNELTLDEQAYLGMLYLGNIYEEQTDPDSPAQPDIFGLCTETVREGNDEYRAVTKENINQFFYDCLGTDFSGYEYSMSQLVEQDGNVYTHGGDWGMSWPFAEVTNYEKENGQIRVEGTLGYIEAALDEFGDAVYDQSPERVEKTSFEAILEPSDSEYLDGYTIQSFRYESSENEVSTEESAQNASGAVNYTAFLQQVHDNPSEYVEESMDIEEDQFAIADIDQDGKEELIIQFTDTYMAGQYSAIWSWNDATGTMELQQEMGTSCDYYSNGMLVEYASHNHSYGFAVWPSEIYKYDTVSGQYQHFASVSSADAEVDTEGVLYSTDKDADGDGIIYFFDMDGQVETPLTETEYQSYCDQYIPESEKIELNWMNLTQTNIDGLAQ